MSLIFSESRHFCSKNAVLRAVLLRKFLTIIQYKNSLSHCFSMGDLGVQVSVASVHQHLPWVSCERNSTYSFLPIFLKLRRCFLHGVSDCRFGVSPVNYPDPDMHMVWI